MDPTEKNGTALELIPDPQAVRELLAYAVRDAAILRQQLKASERAEEERADRLRRQRPELVDGR